MRIQDIFPDGSQPAGERDKRVDAGESRPATSTDDRELEAVAYSLDERARALVIDSPAAAEYAMTWLRDEVVPRRKAIVDWFAPLKAAAYESHRTICERERLILSRIPEAIIKQKIGTYQAEQRRLRQIAEQEAAAEAARLAEIAREAAFDAAVEAGNDRAAAAILDAPAPLVTVPPVAVPEPVAVTGVSQRTTWTAEVTDFGALIRWVAESPGERQQYLEPVMPALNAIAKRLKSALAIPGVRAVERMDLGVTTAAMITERYRKRGL